MDALGDSNRQDTRDTSDTEAPRSGLSRSHQRWIPPSAPPLLSHHIRGSSFHAKGYIKTFMPVHNELEVCRVVDYESYAKPITAFTPVAIFTATTTLRGNSHLAKSFKNTLHPSHSVSGDFLCGVMTLVLCLDTDKYVNLHKCTFS